MKFSILIFLMLTCQLALGQHYKRQDSLIGSITPEREWWDIKYYHLDIEVIPEQRQLKGSVRVDYQVLQPHQVLQIDLHSPLRVTSVSQDGQALLLRSEGSAHFITLSKTQVKGSINSLIVNYEGIPKEAENAPWDGGFSWKQDKAGNHFAATSCQGIGASVWWPCKDHMYDEVDSMLISVEIPQGLTNVSNGRLIKTESNPDKKTKTYHWFVNNPINNYGVSVNIGDYISWTETHPGDLGDLNLKYWVLKSNERKARKQFKQVPMMLKAFEHWLGPYPFYRDGYQIVETPFLGMEHQSAIAYGNEFDNGYLGRDLSGTGQGLKFDFIIIHESGHEWFANSITHRDAADLWIHESFTSYSESLYLEYYYGKQAGQEYVRGTRKNVRNQYPLIGDYGINYAHPDADVYYKGANVLNMIRQILGDDQKWRNILRGLNKQFYHQTVNSTQVENYIIQQSGLDLKPIFEQYLRSTQIPIFEYYIQGKQLNYRWTNCIDSFAMFVDVLIDSDIKRLKTTTRWQSLSIGKINDIKLQANYYVGLSQIK